MIVMGCNVTKNLASTQSPSQVLSSIETLAYQYRESRYSQKIRHVQYEIARLNDDLKRIPMEIAQKQRQLKQLHGIAVDMTKTLSEENTQCRLFRHCMNDAICAALRNIRVDDLVWVYDWRTFKFQTRKFTVEDNPTRLREMDGFSLSDRCPYFLPAKVTVGGVVIQGKELTTLYRTLDGDDDDSDDELFVYQHSMKSFTLAQECLLSVPFFDRNIVDFILQQYLVKELAPSNRWPM
jgi:hypothetical protein